MIGIFDSGLGGLTAYKELHALLPAGDFVYFVDTGRVPYGSRSREILTRYARQDIRFLLRQGADVILAKGMANAETMLGCGYNVYYAFLVKCQRFVTRFGKPMFTPMLVKERE